MLLFQKWEVYRLPLLPTRQHLGDQFWLHSALKESWGSSLTAWLPSMWWIWPANRSVEARHSSYTSFLHTEYSTWVEDFHNTSSKLCVAIFYLLPPPTRSCTWPRRWSWWPSALVTCGGERSARTWVWGRGARKQVSFCGHHHHAININRLRSSSAVV